MASVICTLAWIAALLAIPFLIIWRATESRDQRICRLHRQGLSQRAISAKLQISRYQVGKTLRTA